MAFWKKIMLVVLTLASSFVWYAIFTAPDGRLEVSFLDVGQGDAVFIETPSGRQVLIDGGPGRKVLSELAAVMPAYDRSIDVVIATHSDFDHIAGLTEVLGRYDVGMVLENGLTADTKIYKTWDAILGDKQVLRHTVSAGDRLVLDDGVVLNILGPVLEDFPPAGGPPPAKANEAMVVSQLVYGASAFLLTGDLEKGDEIRLTNSTYDLRSDVLKVAHHGSKNASTEFFLEKVSPLYNIISVGDHNQYGHPNTETLMRLKEFGAQLFRTDISGRITFESDGKVLRRGN